MGSYDLECKGCTAFGIFSKETPWCILKAYYESEECPCLSCIVKMVCHGNDCIKINNFYILQKG